MALNARRLLTRWEGEAIEGRRQESLRVCSTLRRWRGDCATEFRPHRKSTEKGKGLRSLQPVRKALNPWHGIYLLFSEQSADFEGLNCSQKVILGMMWRTAYEMELEVGLWDRRCGWRDVVSRRWVLAKTLLRKGVNWVPGNTHQAMVV